MSLSGGVFACFSKGIESHSREANGEGSLVDIPTRTLAQV